MLLIMSTNRFSPNVIRVKLSISREATLEQVVFISLWTFLWHDTDVITSLLTSLLQGSALCRYIRATKPLSQLPIKFDLRRNSGSVRIIGTQFCSVTSPKMNVKLSPFFKTSYDARLMLDNYSISHNLRRSRPPLTIFIGYVAFSI